MSDLDRQLERREALTIEMVCILRTEGDSHDHYEVTVQWLGTRMAFNNRFGDWGTFDFIDGQWIGAAGWVADLLEEAIR